jgi:TolB-like protein
MSKEKSFWSELKSRHVVRAAIAHVVFFWLLAQVAETVLPYIGVVDEPVRWAVVAGVALFPVTLIAAWFLEHPWHRFTSSRLVTDVLVIAIITVAALLWVSRNLPQVLHTKTSIVILPFEFRHDDPGGQGLSRALVYEINGLLLKSKSVDVIGYQSASSELLEGLDVAGISDMLDVNHLLAGDIIVAGDPFRVAVRLLGRGGEALWSEEFAGSLNELYDVQERIAAEVESRLGAGGETMKVAEVAAARCPMPSQPSALERYYTARHYVEARTESPESIAQQNEAVAIYQSLIEEFPEFAQARSGLAWAIRHLTVYDPANNDRVAAEVRSKQLAEEAVGICPTLGEALIFLPNEADHPNRWINTDQNLRLWIRLQPEAGENHQKLVRHLKETGRLQEALSVARRNLALNPLSVRAIKELGGVYQMLGRFDEAIALHERAVALGSTSPAFARMSKRMHACGEDLDCRMENLPPPMRALEDQFRIIYRQPETQEQAGESIALALELLAANPDMMLNWFNATACNFDHLTPLFFDAWDLHLEVGGYWYWPNLWRVSCGKVWGSEEFPAFAEEVGLAEYWRDKGWADACEPGSEGFQCSQEIFDRNLAGSKDSAGG